MSGPWLKEILSAFARRKNEYPGFMGRREPEDNGVLAEVYPVLAGRAHPAGASKCSSLIQRTGPRRFVLDGVASSLVCPDANGLGDVSSRLRLRRLHDRAPTERGTASNLNRSRAAFST